jgi:hypothetical protein
MGLAERLYHNRSASAIIEAQPFVGPLLGLSGGKIGVGCKLGTLPLGRGVPVFAP